LVVLRLDCLARSLRHLVDTVTGLADREVHLARSGRGWVRTNDFCRVKAALSR
jgi:hypothetical protein